MYHSWCCHFKPPSFRWAYFAAMTIKIPSPPPATSSENKTLFQMECSFASAALLPGIQAVEVTKNGYDQISLGQTTGKWCPSLSEAGLGAVFPYFQFCPVSTCPTLWYKHTGMCELHSFVCLFRCLPVYVTVTGSPGLLAVGSWRRGAPPLALWALPLGREPVQ